MTGFPRKVGLIGTLQHPEGGWHSEDYASAGARGCFDENSSLTIQGEETKREDYEARREAVFRETSGRGHGSVLDQNVFIWSIENLTRASTLFLCGPQYASHLQQSLRRVTVEKKFFPLPSSDSDSFDEKGGFKMVVGPMGNKLIEEQFTLYGEMIKHGIPAEDARIILPLNTKTTIQTLWSARELMHLKSMAERMPLPSDVSSVVEEMYGQAEEVAPAMMKNREKNLEVLAWMPSSQLYSPKNYPIERMIKARGGFSLVDYSIGLKMNESEIEKAVNGRDEALLANLKHTHFTFLIPMSLMAFHQATRQRTWDQSVEPIACALRRGEAVIPPSILGTSFEDPLLRLYSDSIMYALRNLSVSKEALGVVPHGLEVYDLVHINGWNALHSIGKRTCKTAQWEIREKAKQMASEIKRVYPELGKYCLPQGMIYGCCPERKKCGECAN